MPLMAGWPAELAAAATGAILGAEGGTGFLLKVAAAQPPPAAAGAAAAAPVPAAPAPAAAAAGGKQSEPKLPKEQRVGGGQ